MATPATPASRFKFKDEGKDVAAEALAGPQARSGQAEGGALVELTPDESFLHPQAPQDAAAAPAVTPPATETSTAAPPAAATATGAPPAVSTSTAPPVPEKL